MDFPIILWFSIFFGMVSVFATFGFMMPLVGKITASLFGFVMGEQLLCKIRGVDSGCQMND